MGALGRGLLVGAVLAAALAVAPQARGAAFTVNTTDDTISGVCDAIHCSLREAIIAANTSAEADVIGFSILSGPQTIAITSPFLMPQLSGPDTIDGSTQPGYAGTPIIEIDGSGAPDFATGFILPTGSLLRALVVNGFDGTGVRLDGNATLEGSYIGTDITGTVDRGNKRAGVETAGVDNVIGGTAAGAGNLISGNDFSGIILSTGGNQVLGNVIGLNAAGTSAIGNCVGGVRVFNASNTIGGTAAGAGNVISGNQGCSVGGWAGVTLDEGSSGTTVQGNLIGTNTAGTALIPGGDIGVRIMGAFDNLIGGTAPGAANVITAAAASAIQIEDRPGNLATGNRVEGNYIGTDFAGTADLGSAGPAVELQASDNTIGGTVADAGNFIVHNESDGVRVVSGTRNRIVRNVIHDNAGLGIDLGGDGVTANDPGDGDGGPNDLQNYPTGLTATLVGGGQLEIAGTLDSAPGTYTLHFYASAAADPSGFGEGAGFLGSVTSGVGAFSYTFTPIVPVGASDVVTATATSVGGSTSEFSAAVPVTDPTSTGALVGIDHDPPCLNVLLVDCANVWASRIVGTAVAGAFRVLPDYAFEPVLVDRVDVDTSPFTLTYHIKPEAVWSDGIPVTADDFIFTLDSILDPGNNTVKTGYELVTQAENVDAQTVRLTFSQPYPDWRSLFPVVLPEHVLDGHDLDEVWREEIADPVTHEPIGSGPFLLTGRTEGVSLTVSPNPRWWGPSGPYLNSIVFWVVPDANDQFEGISDGSLDLIFPQPQSQIADLGGLDGIDVQSTPGMVLEHLDFNVASTTMPLLRERWFRQAIALSFDRDAAAATAYGDLIPGYRGHHNLFFAAAQAGYVPSFLGYTLDIDAVARLMLDHGCELGADEIWSCDGVRASVRFATTTGNELRAAVQDQIRAQALTAGIELVPDNDSAAVLFTERLPARQYELVMFGWVLGAPLDQRPKYGCGGAQNHMDYCSEDVTGLLVEAESEVDPTARAQLLNEADEILAEDVPTIPLFRRPEFLVRREALHGPEINPGGLATWNVEAWQSVQTFVVNSVDDGGEGLCDAVHCSLREAIAAANASPGPDTIAFAIGDGPVTISPVSALPVVTDPVVLDATTQPGYDGVPLIRLDGTGAGASTPGLDIVAGGSTVRGFSITNFTWDGVKLRDGGGNTVEDNYLGVFPGPGAAATGNGAYGVLADFGSSNNVIRRNLIGGNGFGPGAPYSGIGIWHGSDDNVVEDNEIGARGGTALPNAIGVIVAETTGARLTGNTIAHNESAGVTVLGAAAVGNRIVANSIFSNGGLGIDLGLDGVTPNDEGDTDSGPNALQNFPLITGVTSEDGDTTITGTISGIPDDSFDLQLYENDVCDSSGHGEGASYLGEGSAAVGGGSFSITFSGLIVPVGAILSATATVFDNTSEFGPCFSVTPADTFVVNQTGDLGSGGCTSEGCTLREAIEAANAAPGHQTIVFAIEPPDAFTISLIGSRLIVTDPVTIDGTTQPGGSRTVVDGSDLALDPGDGLIEFRAGSDGSVIRGLAVSGSETNGIVLASDGNTVEDMYVGTDRFGSLAAPNLSGILVTGSDNDIGDTTVAGRNVVSGNAASGIRVLGDRNAVRGNYVGLTADGAAALRNEAVGIEVVGATENEILGNVVSGSEELIRMTNATGTTVVDNLLGTDATGTSTTLALAPDFAGVVIDGGSANQIGNADLGNVIAGTDGLGIGGVGIRIGGSSGNVIERNHIGTDETGVVDFGHHGAGVYVFDDSDDNRIRDNHVAFTRASEADLTGAGVVVASGVGNQISRNRFRANVYAIDLGGDGPTPNDGGAADDADTGPNDLLNFPILDGATLNGDELTLSGRIDTVPLVDVRVELFAREAARAGTGDADRYIDDIGVVADAAGEGAFDHVVDIAEFGLDIDVGDVVVATATSTLNASTSELSAGVVVAEAGGVTAEVTIAPQAGSETVTAPARVELADVPPETFIAAARQSVEAAPLGSIPLGSIPLGSIPLGSIPLGSIGLLQPQIRALLGGVALSTVPLTPPQSWEELLRGTSLAGVPLQSVSLQQALDVLAQATGGIHTVPLGSIGLDNSVLGSLTPEAVGLGVAPLGSIEIGAKGVDVPGSTNLDDWCEWLSGPPVNCTNPASLLEESVLSTSLRGVPLGSIPLGSIPLGSIPLGSIPLGSIPLGSIDIEFSPLGSIPLGSIPLGSIPLGSIPLGSIPLGSIDLQQSPLGSIPLGSIPLGSIATLFTCVPDCPTSGVLRDHVDQLLPDLTLETLMRAVDPSALDSITVADVLLWVAESTLNGYTVQQLVESLLLIPDNELTFADLLAAFLAESSLGWERLNLEAANVNRLAAEGGTARYAVDVELTPDLPEGLGAANSTVVTVTLPEGFAYIPDSSALDGGSVANPTIAGHRLTWTLPLTVGPLYRLTFDAHPRFTLGPAQATVEADASNAPVVAGLAPATVTVGDTFEPNDDPVGSLTRIETSSFYLSYITGAGDVDYFTYPVPSVAGTRVTFNLSHQPVDLDLVVYGPTGQVLRDERAGTEPLDGQPLDDDGPTLTSESDALEPQTLSDLALANLPILGVSTLRAGDDDAVTVVSDGTPGDYVIQVTGFNGGSSPEPYMLRPVERAPVAVPDCRERPFANAGTNATSLTRGVVPAAVDTVFVVNKAQWERVHGAAAVGAALDSLDGLMGELAADGHPSAILQVDADADVQAAVASWSACPTEPTRANDVVREIGRAIDAFRAAHVDAGSNSTVQNIVLLGGDEVIPAARLEDRTTVANEDGYAETFDAASELSTALRLSYFLSDDPYGDVDPIPFFDRQLHIPDVPVGRLPTTPDAAVRAVERFTAFDGRLEPTTALTTGYEFLNDGAEQVDRGLRAIDGVEGTNAPGLIGDGWNKADLVGAFLPGGVPPDLSSINAHADHRALQPATGSALFDIDDLPAVTGGENEAFDGKLVFSMGCHAGLSVSDVFVVSPLGTADWPQAYTQRGGIYASNTGYGYGDGALVAYSEDLQRRFAENLGGFQEPGDLTIGEAMVLAKQDYFGELGLVGVYDEKAASEFTLYGLPMWQIGGTAEATAAEADESSVAAPAAAADDAAGVQSAPTDQELVVEPATGLTAEQLTMDWTPPAPTPVPGGSYVAGQDGVQVTHFRPVQPKTVLPVTVPSAHGALITELSSTSMTPFDPYFARPIVDSTALEPLLEWDRLVHPAKLQTVTTSKLGTAKRHRLVLATGQFSGPPGGGVTGTQRLFPHLQALVFSTPSHDYAKPILGRIVATKVGASVAFSVNTRDHAPNGADDVVRVLVGYLDQPDHGATRAWKFLDLVRTPSTDRWSGAGPLVDESARFLYFVQAVDRSGNVAVSTNKGVYYEEATTAPPSSDGLSIEAPTAPPSGWFGGDVPVTLLVDGEPATGADELEVDVDGAGFERYSGPVTVTGDGPHTITARAPDGREVALTVLIDTGPPQITIASPAEGAEIVQGQPLTADYACLDAGAGVEPSACTGPVADGAAVDTSTPGTKTFTVAAQDRLGKSASKTVTYTVVRRPIVFASSRTGSGDIYSVQEGGGEVVRLTAHSATDAEPAVSADGSKIAFTSTRDGNVELYSMNADGSDVRRLTTHSAIDLSPAWSPDGTKIAFASNRINRQFDVFVMNADGSGVERLTTHSGADLTPDWSPNGQKIVFSSTRTGGADIYVMNANGSAQTRLTTASAIDVEPSWSPDGAKIAFSTNRHGLANFEIYAMNANGSGQSRLTNNSALDSSPSWSPDGAKLVFGSTRNGNFELYVMNANGSATTRVTSHPAIDAMPDW